MVEVIARHFDEILSEVREHCTPVLQVYRGITAEYGKLLQTCSASAQRSASRRSAVSLSEAIPHGPVIQSQSASRGAEGNRAANGSAALRLVLPGRSLLPLRDNSPSGIPINRSTSP